MPTSAGASLLSIASEERAGRVVNRSRWRPFWVSTACLALGLVLFCVVLAFWLEEYDEKLPGYLDALLIWDLLIGIIAAIATGPLHRAGRWNLLLIAVSGFSGMAMPAAAVAAIRLGGRRTRWDAVVVMITALVFQAGVATLLQAPVDGFAWSDLIEIPVVAAITWGCIMWGRSRADRQALLVSLHARAAAAQREREAVARQNDALARSRDADLARTRADERTAIARDMHDSLSHHLSLIAMHAGALAYREDMPPETMRATARTLRDAAEAANGELRDVLMALRARESAELPADSTTPLPTSRTMRDAIEQAQRAGQRIDVTFVGLAEDDLQSLPAMTAASLHRIVGELVVNAARHAPASPLTLTFTRHLDELVVTATNPAPHVRAQETGAGLGLVGVLERARLLGGHATYDDGTDFTVEVHIPWRR